jgi:pimeloyl-ACP methyl ester carboxylesterase
MPGYGQSTGSASSFRNDGAAVLSAIFDALHLQRVVVVGRSVGGKTAFYIAQKDPKRVLRIVVTHPVIPTAVSSTPALANLLLIL